MTKYSFFLCCYFSFLIGMAQPPNKKKVLVIPYGRFEFVSDFTLEEIAEKNNIAANMVFNAYQKAILNQFVIYQEEHFEFLPITPVLYEPYKKYIKYMDGKFDGKSYCSVDIKYFPREEFAKMMEEYHADFVVFINWYQLKKGGLRTKGKKRKRYTYARHNVDYEIYNLLQQKIIGVGKKRLEPEPTEMEASFAFLRLADLDLRYQNFVSSIVKDLSLPELTE